MEGRLQMAKAPSTSQLDLFGAGPEPARQHLGRPPHVPTPEQLLIANELKASGKGWAFIARALGVSKNTVARYYFPSKLAKPPKGRRRHSPTLATRKFVRRAIRGGMTRVAVAKLIGISVPTLKLHYPDELQRKVRLEVRR